MPEEDRLNQDGSPELTKLFTELKEHSEEDDVRLLRQAGLLRAGYWRGLEGRNLFPQDALLEELFASVAKISDTSDPRVAFLKDIAILYLEAPESLKDETFSLQICMLAKRFFILRKSGDKNAFQLQEELGNLIIKYTMQR